MAPAGAGNGGVTVTLENDAFKLVIDKISTLLKGLGYHRLEEKEPEKDGKSAVFSSSDAAYGVFYLESRKRFELRACGASDGVPDGKWKSVSMWLFDPETDTPDDAENIANDFIETIRGPVQITSVRKKKHRKDDDDNVDPIFFFNRFVGVFPELKEALNEERKIYSGVRAVVFARSKLLPKLEALCSEGADHNAINRCCSLLNEMYVSGDMDVRSVITIVLLNGLSERAIGNIKPLFSTELAKGYKAGLKMNGKKVKPEKKKKRKKIMADTLNELSK